MSEQREMILELYKNPSDFGVLQNYTHSGEKHNTSCGDQFTIQLIIEKDKIVDAKFQGSGCAISTAALCLLLDKVKGMKLTDAQKLTGDDMIALLDIPISAGRMPCATLGIDILKHELSE